MNRMDPSRKKSCCLCRAVSMHANTTDMSKIIIDDAWQNVIDTLLKWPL